MKKRLKGGVREVKNLPPQRRTSPSTAARTGGRATAERTNGEKRRRPCHCFPRCEKMGKGAGHRLEASPRAKSCRSHYGGLREIICGSTAHCPFTWRAGPHPGVAACGRSCKTG